MSQHQPVAFIVAKDRRHADMTMRVDLDWPMINFTQGHFLSSSGERVRYVESPEYVRGHRGARVYLGYGYSTRRDWPDWKHFFLAYGMEMVDVSEPLARQRYEASLRESAPVTGSVASLRSTQPTRGTAARPERDYSGVGVIADVVEAVVSAIVSSDSGGSDSGGGGSE